MIIGVVCLVVLYVFAPRRVIEVARVHLDEEPAPEDAR
jgi:hypothetical protein